MKKRSGILLTVALVFLFAGEVRAQKLIELRGGVNLADVSGYTYDTQFSRGFMVGIYYLELARLGPVTLQPGVDYIQKGFAEDDYRLRLDYIDLSLMFRFSLEEGFVKPFIKAGPYVGYNIAAVEQIGDREDDEEVNEIDYGGSIEAGFTVNSLILGIRASHGLAVIRETFSSEPKNFGIGFYVGFRL